MVIVCVCLEHTTAYLAYTPHLPHLSLCSVLHSLKASYLFSAGSDVIVSEPTYN